MRKGGRIAVALLLAAAACRRAPASRSAASVSPPAAPPYEQRLGKGVFIHYCQACHGETGAGDGFNAFNLNPRPRDLSDAAFHKKKTDAELADTVRRGGAGVGLSPLMPPWGNTLSRRQVDEVVRYVRGLAQKPLAPAPKAGQPG
jgi:mono/diheme cytochrome c family protein